MTKIAVFGDVGGHYTPFVNGLTDIGVDIKNMSIPEDMVVVQVGDLVHKGPDSDLCVELADDMMAANPSQWIQLLGNHEGQYVGGPCFWGDEVELETSDIIRTWFQEKKSKMAVAISDESIGPTLITHAGLSHTWWSQVLSGIQDPKVIASILNKMEAPEVFHPGSMLHGAKPGEGGVAWAWSLGELYEPWNTYTRTQKKPVPFSQVHGHTASYWWDRKKNQITNSGYSGTLRIDHERRHYTLEIGGATFVSVDPGWSKKAGEKQFPYLLEGEVLA